MQKSFFAAVVVIAQVITGKVIYQYSLSKSYMLYHVQKLTMLLFARMIMGILTMCSWLALDVSWCPLPDADAPNQLSHLLSIVRHPFLCLLSSFKNCCQYSFHSVVFVLVASNILVLVLEHRNTCFLSIYIPLKFTIVLIMQNDIH